MTNPASTSPFIVGVTGHRDLDPDGRARLREAVTAFVQQLREYLPDTELRILVGMAEGADLLVAQTAVELGLRVDAVLPMPFEHYTADFDGDSLKLLMQLLKHPGVRCLELAVAAHAGPDAGPVTPAERVALYSNLAETLIRRSSMLLALWDGLPSPLEGGTADTVLRYLGVRTDENRSSDRLDFTAAPADSEWHSPLVYWTPTARSAGKGAVALGPPCFLMGLGDRTLQMQQAMPARLRTQLVLLNRYNQNFRDLTASGAIAGVDSLLTTLPADLTVHDRQALEEIDAEYGKADALAVYYQRHSDRLFGLFGLLAFVMGLAYLVYEKLFESRVLIVVYLFILLASAGIYSHLQGKQWFAKHLVCRVIAETMRAKFFLRLAATDHLVDAESVLRLSGIDSFHGFHWIGHVLKSVGVLDSHPETARFVESFESRHVDRAWIEAQFRYFTRKVAQLERSSRQLKVLKNTMFIAIIWVVTTLVMFGEEVSYAVPMLGGMATKNLLTFGVGVLAVLLGVLELHQNKMATRELLWQYRNQLTHFSRAREQLAHTTSPGRRRDVIADLGRDSLMESYLWTLHRYHREHEPPVAR